MELAMIGLGKMGLNMTTRLIEGGHSLIGYDRSPESLHAAVGKGARTSSSLSEAASMLKPRRIFWLMIPAGKPTDETVDELSTILEVGDIVIDGGNSNYKDSLRHADILSKKGIQFVDCGTSGGVWGLAEGYSLMIGGKPEVAEYLSPIFETLAPARDRGWGRVGPSGAGHFVKMVHNGIEYGLMQAYAEGFGILQGKQEFELDLAQIAEIWRYGSVVRSWLLNLAARALHEDSDLSSIEPWVADSGEGRWTIAEAIDLDIPAPVITLALQMRLASRDQQNFPARLLAALRNQFGGHAVHKADE